MVVTIGFVPATVVVVFVPAAPAAVVLVVGAVVVLVVVEAADLADVDLVELFLVALGLELPQAAAMSPAVTMTAPTLTVLRARPWARCDVWAELFKVICPHSVCGLDRKNGAAGIPTDAATSR